ISPTIGPAACALALCRCTSKHWRPMSRRRHTARDISPPPMFSDGENLPSPTARRPPRHGPPATTLVPSSQPTPEGNARKHFLSFSWCCRCAVALQPLIERVMLKMKALPRRLVHVLDACAPRTTHGRSSHLNSDPHVAAINITALAQPFEKGRQRPPIARSKIGVKKSDHRHRRLLRSRRERPRSRCAAKNRYEVAAVHSIGASGAGEQGRRGKRDDERAGVSLSLSFGWGQRPLVLATQPR